MNKKVKSYNLNIVVAVKRMRKAINEKNVQIFHNPNPFTIACQYTGDNGEPGCIIGAALPPKVKQYIKKKRYNESGLDMLISDGLIKVNPKYQDRLIRIQGAHDEADLKALRSRLRHLENSVKKDYPKSFK